MIPSEEQAERLGERLTGGVRDTHFKVFMYEQAKTRLTLFGVELPNGQQVTDDRS